MSETNGIINAFWNIFPKALFLSHYESASACPNYYSDQLNFVSPWRIALLGIWTTRYLNRFDAWTIPHEHLTAHVIRPVHIWNRPYWNYYRPFCWNRRNTFQLIYDICRALARSVVVAGKKRGDRRYQNYNGDDLFLFNFNSLYFSSHLGFLHSIGLYFN